MKDAVVDSSVALKWVITEDDTEQALALRQHYRFQAPDLIHAECTNALWKLGRSGAFSANAINVALRALQADTFEIVPTRFLMDEALRLALELRHPAYDCIFAALARREDCPVVTADATFMRKMKGQSVRVINIEEALATAGD